MNVRRSVTGARAAAFGMAAAILLSITPAASGQDTMKEAVPFAFQVGAKTLPAGTYEFRIDREAQTVTVVGSNKFDAIEPFLTTLALPEPQTGGDGHIVFDKVGSGYTLSELWEPGFEGILVHATKGKHGHHVIHVKKNAWLKKES